jgi:hypothetical protein
MDNTDKEWEREVLRFFHGNRDKRKPVEGADRIFQAAVRRSRMDEAARRHAWERGWG